MAWTLWMGLAFILTHELDAMTACEWRILPGLSRLDDDAGRWWFVALHVPLFAVVLWGLTGSARDSWAVGFDLFLMLHVVAHAALHRHPENGFRRPLSWALIGGAGLAGALDLAMRWSGG